LRNMSSKKEADRRLVFKTNSEDELGAVCVNNFWMLEAQRLGDAARQIPLEVEYASYEVDIRVVYVDDPISECAYAVVSGADRDKACELIQKETETWSDEEVLEAWRAAPHDSAQISAILRVGVAAPFAHDEGFAKVLKEGLDSEDRAVREAAIAALGYRGWIEFDPVLKNIVEHDADERCRNRAALMLTVREQDR